MRVLGLDIGSKRIGIAISDAEGNIAFPAGRIDRQGRQKDLEALRALIRERGVERVVVGLPKHMDGREGVEARAARDFAADLSRVAKLPVDTLDERWTTVEAERVLRESGRRGKKKRDVVDSVAASIILDTYLALRRNEQAREEGAHRGLSRAPSRGRRRCPTGTGRRRQRSTPARAGRARREPGEP